MLLNILRFIISSTSSVDVAVIVALRGLPVSSESSPHEPPASMVRTFFPAFWSGTTTSHEPSLIT